jgi:tetratricopeptide (TPR) repeat protein
MSLMLQPAAAPAPSAAELLQQAEETFREGAHLAPSQPGDARMCFRCAAAMYEKLHRMGVVNPQLYGNLGNAYLLSIDPDNKQDDGLAQAILAYRRGLHLAPDDAELQRLLAHARQQVQYPPPGTFGQPGIEHRPPWLPRWPGLWFALAGGGYALSWLALARWWMVRRRVWLSVAAFNLAAALLFLSFWGIECWQLHAESRYPTAVVAQDGLQLLVGNGSRFPARYETPINRGVEARVRYDRGRWLQVELAGGEIGWVPRAAVLVDAP